MTKIQIVSREHKNFLEVEELITREFYDFYRQNRKKVAEGINEYNLFKKAVGGLLLSLKHIAQNTEGGIHIRGVGYFCHVKSQRKGLKHPADKSFFKRIKKGYYYIFWFFPDEKFNGWYLEQCPDIRRRKKKIEYKLYFSAIKAHYSAQDYSKKLYKKIKNIYKY